MCLLCEGAGIIPDGICSQCGEMFKAHKFFPRMRNETPHPFKTSGIDTKVAAETRRQRLDIAKNAPPDQSTVVHTFPDGWTIRQLKTFGDEQREGELMRHCLAQQDWEDGGWRDNEDAAYLSNPIRDVPRYSLRDPDNLPHVTFDHYPPGEGSTQYDHFPPQPFGQLAEVYGRHNSEPKPQHVRYMKEWLETKDYPTKEVIFDDDHARVIGHRDFHVPQVKGQEQLFKTAKWADVRMKAVRLKNAGAVTITKLTKEEIRADVQGDHAVYQSTIYRRIPKSLKISDWECTCPWNTYAFGRAPKYRKYEARVCSHVLATYFVAGRKTSKVAAFSRHDPHDLDDEKTLRRHILRKHVEDNDEDLKGSIRNRNEMPLEDLQQFHDDDHEFFMPHEQWSDDSDALVDWDDYKSTKPSKTKQWKKEPPKPAEDYVKDIQPEPKRADLDFDYDTRWFTGGRNHDILDTVKHLSDNYPVTKKWFRGITISEKCPVPCVVTHNQSIWLPPDYLDHPKDSLPRSGLNGLIAHEFGHVLQASILHHDVGPEHVPDLSMQDLLDRKYTDSDLEHPDSPATWMMNEAKQRYPKDFISHYAETNQRERFAEAMSKYWTEPPASHDRQSAYIGQGIDFMYHRLGRGWKMRNEKTEKTARLFDIAALLDETPKQNPHGRLIIRTKTGQTVNVNVEIADTPRAIKKGLMYRARLAKDAGMVFVPQSAPSYNGFWMQSTKIPLSIAFWDKHGRIIEVLDMDPCPPGTRCPTYSCSKPYWGAVEVNQGFFKTHGIGPGDHVELER